MKKISLRLLIIFTLFSFLERSKSHQHGNLFDQALPAQKTEPEKATYAYNKAKENVARHPFYKDPQINARSAKFTLDPIIVAPEKGDSLRVAHHNAGRNEAIIREPQESAKAAIYPKTRSIATDLLDKVQSTFQTGPTQPTSSVCASALPILKDNRHNPLVRKTIKSIAVTDGPQMQVNASGTGKTTGHIADLHVRNDDNHPIDVLPQTFFIPSDGKHQPYVARIPDLVTIPPSTSVTIPISGYCADVRTPPVGSGEPMIPVSDWIPVGDMPHPTTTPAGIPVTINNINPLPDFSPEMIPSITSSPVYKPKSDNTSTYIPTWPGTVTRVNGVIPTHQKLDVIAPVLVSALKNIEEAAVTIISKDEYKTPFHADSALNYSSCVQQTFWIFTAAISGEDYKQQEFAENVYKQFKSNTNISVERLTKEQKENLDNGINQFWNTFTAIGIEAKVLTKNPHSTSPTPPTISEQEKSPCSLKVDVDSSVVNLDYAIANTGTKEANEKVKEAFKKAIYDAAGLTSDLKGSDKVDVGFSTPDMPASAWSLYFTHVVGGRANAYAMAIDIKNPTKSAFTTEPLTTKSKGEHTVILTHSLGSECKSTLVGINLAKVRAASRLNASLDNNSIKVARVLNFIGEVAIDIVLLRGRGFARKLRKYFKEKIEEMDQDAAKEYIKEEIKNIAKQLEGKTDEEAEKTMDELIKDMKSGKLDKDDLAEEKSDKFIDVIADILIEGSKYNPSEKAKDEFKDKVDSPIDLAPSQTHTYAIAEGSLEVYVDENKAIAKSGSGVRYKRKGLEDKEEAEKGGGVFCKEALVSKTTSGTITAKTIGNVETRAGATGEGIFSTGHGIATATLESFNGIYIIAICECPNGVYYENFTSTTCFSLENEMTDIYNRVFEKLLNEVYDSVVKDVNELKPEKSLALPQDYATKLEKKMENAAKKAAAIILPCDEHKK